MSNNTGVKMRPVTADRKYARQYNKAIDDDVTNPYASMY